MPQRTFHLVPSTLARPNAVPNKPMTSKAAKEAYRKANKGPKISRAEQRRLDAEELVRQKKEFERERSAAKAKAARDRKLEQERKAREERKKKGEPEPRKGVRASQLTIKGFVSTGKGKRGWEDLDDTGTDTDGEPPRKLRPLEKPQELETETETEEGESRDFPTLAAHEVPPKTRTLQKQEEDDEFGMFPILSLKDDDQVGSALKTAEIQKPTKILEQLRKENEFHAASTFSRPTGSRFEDGTDAILSDKKHSPKVLQQREEEDDFGDFPSLSQTDLSLFDTPITDPRIRRRDRSTSSTVNAKSLPNNPDLLLCRDDLSYRTVSSVDEAEVDFLVESQLLLEASVAVEISQSVWQQPVLPSSPPKPTLPRLVPTITSTNPNSKISTLYDIKVLNKSIKSVSAVNCTSKNCAAPRITPKLADGSSRRPFGELSGNMPPPKCPPLKPTNFKPKQTRAPTKIIHGPPPSTMTFLEAHLDDFFPSPSQQVRELLEDIEYMPSNTQIEREIENEPPSTLKLHSIPKSDPEVTPKPLISQTAETSIKATDDLCLHLFSSQDFEISSQDLRDIDTPRKTVSQHLKCPTSAHHDLGILGKCMSISPKARPSMPKPRFFEEKEEDLLYAALQESLAMAEQETKRPRLKENMPVEKENRSLKRVHSSAETDYGDDDIDYDEFDGDPQPRMSNGGGSNNFGDYVDEVFGG